MKTWKRILLHVTLFLFTAAVLGIVYLNSQGSIVKGKQIKLVDGWTIKVNDETYDSVNLTEFRIPAAERGDWIVMTNVLPEDTLYNSTICLYVVNSMTDVYIDEEHIFDYGKGDVEDNLYIGYGNRFVSLPSNSAGKTIKITFLVTENNSFTTLTPPIIYDESTVYRDYLDNRLFPLAVSLTLIVMGICISVITFCLYFRAFSMEKLFCIGIFSLCIGLWSLCSHDLDYLFTSSLRVKCFLEFMSFYLMLFPMLLYFREDIEKRNNKVESFIFGALLLIEIQMFAITIVCQMLNFAHFPAFETLYHIFMGIVAGFIVLLILKSLKEENSHTILLGGLSIGIVFAIRDLISYNVLKYFSDKGTEGDFYSCLPVGALVFVASLLVDFIYEMRKSMYASAQNEFLTRIAYVDVLTGLSTRRKIEEIFVDIEKNHGEYALIQFDLNNLKTTNDDYGHEKGDELLLRFANILENVFCNKEIIGRMGGDEFVVVIKNAYGYDVEQKIDQLKMAMDESNKSDDPVKVSTSYGFCRSSEFDNPSINEVYMTADRRMYVNKEEYYRATGKGRRRYD